MNALSRLFGLLYLTLKASHSLKTDSNSQREVLLGQDIVTSAWVEQRIKESRESIESRITGERDFVKSVFGIVAKICAAAFFLIVGVVGFVGYKDISTIDEKILKSVNEKVKEKSDEFSDLYKKNVQGLADQALITAYSIQFSAPQKKFDRSVIAPVHVQRFAQILGEESSDDKILDSLYELLSDPGRDENSNIINYKLQQMALAEGSFSWVKNRPERLTKAIDLLTQRQVKGDPARIRFYLTNDSTAPVVKESAMRYAAMASDRSALPYIINILNVDKTNPSVEALYALISIDPGNEWISQWLETQIRNSIGPQSKKPPIEKISLIAKSVAKAVEANFKAASIPIFYEPNSKLIEIASKVVRLISDSKIKLFLDKDPFSEKTSGAYRLFLSAGDGSGYTIPLSLIIDEGEAVITNTFIEAIRTDGLSGMRRVLNIFSQESFSKFKQRDVNYNIQITVPETSALKIDVDGKENSVTDQSVYLSIGSNQSEHTKATWRTNEGIIKTGIIKEIGEPDMFRFKVNISKTDLD